jgi:secreted trypsin-like serine protease
MRTLCKSARVGDDFVGTDEADLGSGDSDAQALDLEGTSVEGDSGGPLFIKIGNQWVLAGVLSGGADAPIEDFEDSSYGDISIFTRVSSYIDWINSVIQP